MGNSSDKEHENVKKDVENLGSEKEPEKPAKESAVKCSVDPTPIIPQSNLEMPTTDLADIPSPHPLHIIDPPRRSLELVHELSCNERKLVMAKSDQIYEVFLCDKCDKQIKSRNIYLCATCDYNFGLCERCVLLAMRARDRMVKSSVGESVLEQEAALRLHEHPLTCVPNTFYKPYNISLHNDIKFADDDMTVQLLACHPLTHRFQIERRQPEQTGELSGHKEEEQFVVNFENHLYLGHITSKLVSIHTIIDVMPVLLKTTRSASFTMVENTTK